MPEDRKTFLPNPGLTEKYIIPLFPIASLHVGSTFVSEDPRLSSRMIHVCSSLLF